MNIAKLLLTFVSVAALSACSMTKNLDEMHDSTNDMKNTTNEMNGKMGQMNDTTSTMSKTTEEMKDVTKGMAVTTGEMKDITAGMSQTTNEMKATTCEMYTALRQGDSMTARRNGLRAVEQAEAGAPKISEAAKYFMSFEFQIWSNLCRNNNKVRMALAADAAKEFMRDVQEFINAGQTEPMPFAKSPKTSEANANRQQSLNALSVALHMVNPKQESNMQNENVLSMWDMIKNALKASQQMAAGKRKISDYPEYVNQILIYESVAKLLAQTRFNYFGAMMISRASHIREGIIPFVKMRYLSWTLDLSKYGQVEVTEFGNYLNGGNKAFEFMTEAGIKPQIDKDLLEILENMKISNELKAAAKADPAKASPRVAAESEFLARLIKYRHYAGITTPLSR